MHSIYIVKKMCGYWLDPRGAKVYEPGYWLDPRGAKVYKPSKFKNFTRKKEEGRRKLAETLRVWIGKL